MIARRAFLCLESSAGRTETPVEIIGETAWSFRIRAIMLTKLSGGNRWLNTGKTAFVPRHTVRFDAAA